MSKPFYMRPKPTTVPTSMNAWVDLQNFCIHRVSHTAEKQSRFLCRLGTDDTPCKHVNCPFKDVQLSTENLEKLYQEMLDIEEEFVSYDPNTGKRNNSRQIALKHMTHDPIIMKQLKAYIKIRKEDVNEPQVEG